MMFKNSFIATVKSGGKILREQGETVYIPFGSEYSILMKNLKSRSCLVSISIDGQDVLNGDQLIVRANSQIELERFLEDLNFGNRFKFIQKTKKIQDHRGDKIDDGIVRIEVVWEKEIPPFKPTLFYNENCRGISSGTRSKGISETSFGYYGDLSSTYCSTNTTISNCINNVSTAPLSDEGITVGGSMSNQKFKVGNIGQLESTSEVFTFSLKGIVNEQPIVEPITVKTKLVCPTCGTKNKSSNKFCAECGTNLM